ncbi:MAG: hypothetical protein PUC88_05215 [Clostridia bacterium]|nr:hypothetical protein [Clostridia bacterium]
MKQQKRKNPIFKVLSVILAFVIVGVSVPVAINTAAKQTGKVAPKLSISNAESPNTIIYFEPSDEDSALTYYAKVAYDNNTQKRFELSKISDLSIDAYAHTFSSISQGCNIDIVSNVRAVYFVINDNEISSSSQSIDLGVAGKTPQIIYSAQNGKESTARYMHYYGKVRDKDVYVSYSDTSSNYNKFTVSIGDYTEKFDMKKGAIVCALSSSGEMHIDENNVYGLNLDASEMEVSLLGSTKIRFEAGQKYTKLIKLTDGQYKAEDIAPAKMISIDVIEASSSASANECYVNTDYKIKASTSNGYSRMNSLSKVSVSSRNVNYNASTGVWSSSTVGTKTFTLAFSNSVEKFSTDIDIEVYDEVEYPTVSLQVDGEHSDSAITKYVPDGTNQSLKFTADIQSGQVKYHGATISDYKFIFEFDSGVKETTASSYDHSITGNDDSRGIKECSVKISFSRNGKNIVSPVLSTQKVDIKVPSIDATSYSGYINVSTDVEIPTADFEKVYYRVYNSGDDISTDTEGYTQDSSGTIKVKLNASDNTDKVVSVIGFYDGDKYIAQKATYKIDSKEPSLENITAQALGAANLNIIDYGIFANGKFELAVTASDDKSGVQDIFLCKKDGDTYQPISCTSTTSEDGNTVKFIVEAPTHGVFSENLAVQIIDKAGNSTVIAIEKVESGAVTYTLLDNVVIVEYISPDITVESAHTTTESSQNTYADHTTIDISLKDEHSGLGNYYVNINGVTVKKVEDVTKQNGMITHEASFKVSTGDVAKSSDGKYSIYVYAEDNAGNNSIDSTTTVYLDVTAPKIISYKINTLGNGVTSNNVLKDGSGAFVYNDDIELTIVAKDEGKTAGISTINVTQNDNISMVGDPEVSTDTDGGLLYTATYLIKQPFSGKVEATIIDKARNSSETSTVPTSTDKDVMLFIANKGINYDKYWLDANKYANFCIHLSSDCNAMFTRLEPDSAPVYRGDGKNWYNSHVDFTATAEEFMNKGTYGLKLDDTYVQINNKDVPLSYVSDTQKQNGVVVLATYKFNTSKVAPHDTDGEFIIKGSVADGADNKSESSYTFYIDRKAPAISGFKMTPNSSSNGVSAGLVEVTDYGYFFRSDTTVEISANDGIGDSTKDSGVKAIYYEIVPVKGEKATGEIKGHTGKITVKAGFKGQIYAYAVDNVGNKGSNVHPDGVIVENEALHNSTSSVKLSIDSSDYKDAAGNKLYNKDVNIKLSVQDTFSGIKSVTYSVEAPYDTSKNMSDTTTVTNGSISDSTWKKDGSEMNIVTAMSKNIKVSSNSNDIVVKLTLKDNAGNTTSKSIKFSIDKTAPKVSINFDGSNGGYYSSTKTVTFTVTERNLELSSINKYVSANISSSNGGSIPKISWSLTKDRNNPDNNKFVGVASFANDGAFECSINARDMVGNKSNKSSSIKFTIDKTAPVITFSMVSRYNNTAQTVTVTVVEANFDANAALNALNINAKNGTAPRFGGFKSSGNTHTASATFSSDGDYTISMNYTDKAGNTGTGNVSLFTVDANKPKIVVKGIENKKAYTDSIISFSVDVTDVNLQSVDILLTGVCRDKVEYVSTVPCSATIPITNGTRYTWSNIKTGADGIYTLTCVAKDIAGNVTEILRKQISDEDDNTKIVFSVNRDGSTYEVSKQSKPLMGSWVNSSKIITFSEINADPIDLEKIVVKMTNKSTLQELELVYGEDYTVELVDNGGQWYEYQYKILSDNFTDDGFYDIEVISVDTTNKTTSSKDNAYGTQLIAYGLDTHSPNIDISGINDGPYDSITRDAIVNVTDISLSKVTVYVDGKVAESWDAKNSGETYNGTITLNESAATQKVTVEAVDAAGNISTSEQEVFVSSNGFSIFMYRAGRFFSNNWGWLIAIAVVVAAIIAYVVIKKRNDKKNSKPAVNKKKTK